MRVTVNGKPREVQSDGARSEMPLPDLLAAFDVNPRLVAVAINGEVIDKQLYAEALVRDGDALEVVRMVGGGAARRGSGALPIASSRRPRPRTPAAPATPAAEEPRR